MSSKLVSYMTLLIGVLSLSTSAIFVRLANAPASITAFYRLFFVVLLLTPVVALSKTNRSALRTMTRKQWQLGMISGLFLAIHFVLWFESLNYTSIASSTVIVTLQPLFSLAACSLLFKERFSKGAVIGCIIAISGCFVIGWGDFQVSTQALIGDFMALAAAGMITVYFLIGQHMRKSLPVIPYSYAGYLASALALAIYAFSQGLSFTDYPRETWTSFLGLACIATILGQMSFNWLLKWFSTSVISMCILGEVIGTCILAYFILNETITIQQGIGILIILSGLALFLVEESRKSKQGSLGNEISAHAA